MTEERFRRLALEMPEAVESSHMGHPDFRVGGRIFATLRPDEGFGVVMLPPEAQPEFVEEWPRVFEPVKGYWGERGATKVLLPRATVGVVRPAMEAAWIKVAPKRLVRELGAVPSRRSRRTR